MASIRHSSPGRYYAALLIDLYLNDKFSDGTRLEGWCGSLKSLPGCHQERVLKEIGPAAGPDRIAEIRRMLASPSIGLRRGR
jgi:hypothetical protein